MKLTTGETVTFEIIVTGINAEKVYESDVNVKTAELTETISEGEDEIRFIFECSINNFSPQLIKSVKDKLKEVINGELKPCKKYGRSPFKL